MDGFFLLNSQKTIALKQITCRDFVDNLPKIMYNVSVRLFFRRQYKYGIHISAKNY